MTGGSGTQRLGKTSAAWERILANIIDKRHKDTEKEDMRIKRDVTCHFAATLTNAVVYSKNQKVSSRTPNPSISSPVAP